MWILKHLVVVMVVNLICINCSALLKKHIQMLKNMGTDRMNKTSGKKLELDQLKKSLTKKREMPSTISLSDDVEVPRRNISEWGSACRNAFILRANSTAPCCCLQHLSPTLKKLVKRGCSSCKSSSSSRKSSSSSCKKCCKKCSSSSSKRSSCKGSSCKGSSCKSSSRGRGRGGRGGGGY